MTSLREGAPAGVLATTGAGLAAMTGIEPNRRTATATDALLTMTQAPTGEIQFQFAAIHSTLNDVSLSGSRRRALAPFHIFARRNRCRARTTLVKQALMTSSASGSQPQTD